MILEDILFKRSIKRIRKENEHKFIPFTISIMKMCERNNIPECYTAIRNRILREMEEYPRFEDHVYFNAQDLSDIMLDDDGVFIFCDILYGYFEQQSIIDLWKHMRDKNKHERQWYEYEHLFDNMNPSQLSEFIINYMDYEAKPGQEETKQELLAKARAALRQRKKLFA